MKKPVRLFATLSLVLAGVVVAPGAQAAGPSPYDWLDWKVGPRLSIHEPSCTGANRTGATSSYAGPGRSSVSATSRVTADLRETAGARRVVGKFAGTGTLSLSESTKWDGSRNGAFAFTGSSRQDALIGTKCHATLDMGADMERVLIVPRAATVKMSMVSDAHVRDSVWVYVTNPYNADVTEHDFSSATSAGSVRQWVTARVPAGHQLTFRVGADVDSRYSSTTGQVGQGPITYYPNDDARAGKARMTYSIVLDPAPGQQAAPSAPKTKRTITFPTSLKCSSKYLTIKPKKVSKARSMTVKANGKTLKKFTKVKKSMRVKLKKARDTTVTVKVWYRSGKVATVKKTYHGCR